MNLTLFLGHTPSGTPVSLKDLDNPHVFLSGRSGSGKSYFLRRLTSQAVEQGCHVLVFDYTGDFVRGQPNSDIAACRIAVNSPEFTLNPLVAFGDQDADMCVQQMLSLLHTIFRMGPRATLQLRKAAREYIAQAEDIPTLDGLRCCIQSLGKPSIGLQQAMEPLELLASLIRCGSVPISLTTAQPGLTILDFNALAGAHRTFLVELILRALFDQRVFEHEPSYPPLVLVLDECQNLPWSESSMAVRILREGRKFDLAGWFASQWIDNRTATAALGQATLQAHFRPDDQNAAKLAKQLSPRGSKDLTRHLALIQNLRLGQFLTQSQTGQLLQVQVPR